MNLARGVPALAAVLALWLAGCGDGVHRGRVIDQDTGEPVAGAIVVGRYMGDVAWGSASCNRAESAVSDAEGWFELPVDAKDGKPLMEAYKTGYSRGSRRRIAYLKDPWTREWKVSVLAWNSDNSLGSIVAEEPEVYRFEFLAKAASGEERDVYVRKFTRSREIRLVQLQIYSMDCGGKPRTSRGLVPLIEGVLQEQQAIGAADAEIEVTRRWLQRAGGAQ